MKEFFDTSVLVASFWQGHPRHEASLECFASARKEHSCCALHTLAEVYSTMTALPVKDVISPLQALLFVQEVRDRCTVVSLDESGYFSIILRAAQSGFTSGRIYDALLLGCAMKSDAEVVYTWNISHFKALAPEFGDRIRTP